MNPVMSIASQTQIVSGGQPGLTSGIGHSAASRRTERTGLQPGSSSLVSGNVGGAAGFRSSWQAQLERLGNSETDGAAETKADEEEFGSTNQQGEPGQGAAGVRNAGAGRTQSLSKPATDLGPSARKASVSPMARTIPAAGHRAAAVSTEAAKTDQIQVESDAVKPRHPVKGDSAGKTGSSLISSALPDAPPQSISLTPLLATPILIAPSLIPPIAAEHVPIAAGSGTGPEEGGRATGLRSNHAENSPSPDASPTAQGKGTGGQSSLAFGAQPDKLQSSRELLQGKAPSLSEEVATYLPAPEASTPTESVHATPLSQLKGKTDSASQASRGIAVQPRSKPGAHAAIPPEGSLPPPVPTGSGAGPVADDGTQLPPAGHSEVGTNRTANPSQPAPTLADATVPQSGPVAVHSASSPMGVGTRNTALRETFSALDSTPPAGRPTWTHATPQQAEAGFQDPALGWVSVRADMSGGGVHASLVPGSPQAAEQLGKQMDGIHTYLAEQHTPVESLAIDAPGGMAANGHVGGGSSLASHAGLEQGRNQEMGGGTNQGSGHNGQQESGQGSGPGNGAGTEPGSTGQSKSDRNGEPDRRAEPGDATGPVAGAVSGTASISGIEGYGSGNWQRGEHISLVA